ncbi:gTPase, IMAP member 8, variant 2 [Orbilia oligospora]|nr:gTPase, IMAP member 8, variant 2 [Orbilia oligospora]
MERYRFRFKEFLALNNPAPQCMFTKEQRPKIQAAMNPVQYRGSRGPSNVMADTNAEYLKVMLADYPDAGKLFPFILVMGETGAGKSTFIKTLAPDSDVKIERGLDPGTSTSTVVPVKVGFLSVNLVDTPGFNDIERSDADILLDISKCLVTLSRAGGELRGIIYLHNLALPRFSGTCKAHMEMLQKICGDKGIGNVFLVASNWDSGNEDTCILREQSLHSKYWRSFINEGATFTRFRNSYESAAVIVAQCAWKEPVVFDLQKEILEDGLLLESTRAGLFALHRRSVRPETLRKVLRGEAPGAPEVIEKAIKTGEDDEEKLKVDVVKETDSRFMAMIRSKGAKRAATVLQIIVAIAGIGLNIAGVMTG